MSRYFLHLRDGTDELLDEEGIECDTLHALRSAVLRNARDLMGGDIVRGLVDLRFRIDAQQADGTIVYSLPFKHAVSIIPEGVQMAAQSNDS